MKKKIIIDEPKFIIKHYCDDCGKELNWILQCKVSRCEYCGKDLCEKCIEKEECVGGDYRKVYCKQCWNIAKGYNYKIKKLEYQIDVLETECELKCKENFKKKY